MQTNVNIELLRDNALFTLSRKKFSNSKKIRSSQIQTEANNANRVKGSKVLLVSKELDAIHAALDDLYKWIQARCVPSCFKDGLYLAKASMAQAFNDECERYKCDVLPPLIAAFQVAYDRNKEQAFRELGPLYNESDYPAKADLPGCFGVSYNWFNVTVPDNLIPELQAIEARKLEDQFRQAETEIMAALREGFAEIVSHVTERLTPEPGGKQRIFRDTLFENLTEFIGTFSARNLMNNKELGSLVTKAQEILANVRGNDPTTKAQVLRDSSMTREDARRAFQELKAAVDSTVIERPSRKFELE